MIVVRFDTFLQSYTGFSWIFFFFVTVWEDRGGDFIANGVRILGLPMICCGFVVARNIFLLLFSVKREGFIEFCAVFLMYVGFNSLIHEIFFSV